MKGKKWILDSKFEGEPSPRNFKLVEEDIDENLNSGEVLCEAVYLSVDPYMRVFVNDVKDVMKGEQVAIVVQSKHPDFGVGSLVLGNFGWRSLTKVSDISEIRPIPELGELSPSLALGSLGMPGNAGGENQRLDPSRRWLPSIFYRTLQQEQFDWRMMRIRVSEEECACLEGVYTCVKSDRYFGQRKKLTGADVCTARS